MRFFKPQGVTLNALNVIVTLTDRLNVENRTDEIKMAMKITFKDGATELIPEAVRVDPQNFHEGMYDFYDKNGNLLKQISLFENISWEIIDNAETD